MSEIDYTKIAERLERVERENRFLKRCVALILVAIGAVFVMAQAQSRPRTLEAEKLVIRYPNGKEAIVLGTRKNGVEGEQASADFYSPNYSVSRFPESGSTITISANPVRSDISLDSPKKLGLTPNAGYRHVPGGFSTEEVASFSIARHDDYRELFSVTSDTKDQTIQEMYPSILTLPNASPRSQFDTAINVANSCQR